MDLPDGRRAHLCLGGTRDRDGPLVLVQHGTPDTRWVARTGAEAAAAAGVRLLAVNRPGYGDSTPAPTTPASVAADTTAVLDALGLDRVAVLGMSVGALYAAALAAHHPERVSRLVLVAAPREELRSLDPDEFRAWRAGLRVEDPVDSDVAARWLATLPEPDATALARVLGVPELAASAREALGDERGYLEDARTLVSPWDLRLDDVRGPVHLVHGRHDDRNPPAAATWWTDRLPRAATVTTATTPTTHLATLLTGWPDLLRVLTARS